MNIVDSSGWLEYLSDGINANAFARPLEDVKRLIVPTISVYEVFKVVLRERGEDPALQAVALMKQGSFAELTSDISLLAAKLSLQHKIPMADSIILATAQAYEAVIWTQDKDFEGISGVKYFSKKSA